MDATRNATRKIKVVVFGASAGGIEALRPILERLPEVSGAGVVVAVHSGADSRLSDALSAMTRWPVRSIEDGDRLESNVVHTCPGGAQTQIAGDRFKVTQGRGAFSFQPSIDLLFSSIAHAYGDSALAIVLSGMMNDGVIGAQALHMFGGGMIAQDPQDARHPGMPESIIRSDHPFAVLPAGEIGERLARMISVVPTA